MKSVLSEDELEAVARAGSEAMRAKLRELDYDPNAWTVLGAVIATGTGVDDEVRACMSGNQDSGHQLGRFLVRHYDCDCGDPHPTLFN